MTFWWLLMSKSEIWKMLSICKRCEIIETIVHLDRFLLIFINYSYFSVKISCAQNYMRRKYMKNFRWKKGNAIMVNPYGLSVWRKCDARIWSVLLTYLANSKMRTRFFSSHKIPWGISGSENLSVVDIGGIYSSSPVLNLCMYNLIIFLLNQKNNCSFVWKSRKDMSSKSCCGGREASVTLWNR